VALALSETDKPSQADAHFEGRIAFAKTQTWADRAQSLLEAVENNLSEPMVSVVVISYNQWPLTERCLQSLTLHSERNSTEIVVVDNASQDVTPAQLQAWAAQDPGHRRIVLNAENRGFGPAVNQGLAMAKGEYLAVLNNDIIVSPGWARGMRRHLQTRPSLGMLCSITNNIGNEAQVALAGSTVAEVFQSAQAYTLRKVGQFLPLQVCAFFCVMMHRKTYQAVGPMDEQFVPGFFEDDDYCLRIKALGLEVGCAEDVFVYHELSASFDKLKSAHRQEIFERNKALFEKKWGAWKPHAYRPESLH
jgi:GT2 family glycosyltransferase